MTDVIRPSTEHKRSNRFDEPKRVESFMPQVALTNEQPNGSGVDVKEVLRVLKRYWKLIALVASIILVAGTTRMLMTTPVYRATALVEISPDSRGLVSFQNVNQEVRSDPREFRETQARIIKSDTLAQAVVDQLDFGQVDMLTKVPQPRGLASGVSQIKETVLTPLLDKLLGLANQESKIVETAFDAETQALEAVQAALNVSLVPRSNLFEVGFDSVNPRLAADIANIMAEQYIVFNDDKRFQSTAGAKAYLEREIARVQGKLESSEKDLTEFARTNGLVDLEDNNNIIATRLQELNGALIDVKGERIAAQARVGQVDKGNVASLLDGEQGSLVAELRSEYAQLQKESTQRSQLYQSNHPLVVEIADQVSAVKKALNREVGQIASGVRANLNQLMEKERMLEAAVEQQKTQLLNLQNRAIQYNILKREWETNKQLYSGLLERMKEVGVAAGMEVNNIAIIQRAKPPKFAFKPNRRRGVLNALVLGIAAGVGLAFLIAFFDNTVRTSEDLERITGLSGLGLVPLLSPNDLPQDVCMDLVSHHLPGKDVSEAFRSIRTSLMFSTPAGAPKTLLVTSSAPGEGKSMSAVNLASVLAHNGATVLLIDGDLRKPRLHKVFGKPAVPGLTENVIRGTVDTIHDTEVPNLWLLTAGTPPPNPAEMLSSHTLDQLLDVFVEVYQYVIIDSAPILGLADSVILSTKVDGVMLVSAAHQVSKGTIGESVKRLKAVHAPIVGAIVNRVKPDGSEYGAYSQYYYNYGAQDKARTG